MKRKIGALLSAIVCAFGIGMFNIAPAHADGTWNETDWDTAEVLCSGGYTAVSFASGHIRGRGWIGCNASKVWYNAERVYITQLWADGYYHEVPGSQQWASSTYEVIYQTPDAWCPNNTTHKYKLKADHKYNSVGVHTHNTPNSAAVQLPCGGFF